jgi:hypothetical protein
VNVWIHLLNMKDNHISRNQVINNINIIMDNNMTWKEAVEHFHIDDVNLQKVYIRYIIAEYGYMKALLLIDNEVV